MTVVNAKATPSRAEGGLGLPAWLNGPKSGPNGGSAMGDILISMGILPSRTSDAAAFADKLTDPFLKAYVDELPNAKPFPVVLGGQEFSEVAAAASRGARSSARRARPDAAAAAQADAIAILGRAGK